MARERERQEKERGRERQEKERGEGERQEKERTKVPFYPFKSILPLMSKDFQLTPGLIASTTSKQHFNTWTFEGHSR
jgi:hypothetical protein